MYLCFLSHHYMDFAKIQLTDPFQTERKKQVWIREPAPRPVIGLFATDDKHTARSLASQKIGCPDYQVDAIFLHEDCVPVYFRMESCSHIQTKMIPKIRKYKDMELLAVILPKDGFDSAFLSFAERIHCDPKTLRYCLDLT